MKRFLVFGGCTYYPSGGWEDFKAERETRAEAMEFCASLGGVDWIQIVDTETGVIEKLDRKTYD